MHRHRFPSPLTSILATALLLGACGTTSASEPVLAEPSADSRLRYADPAQRAPRWGVLDTMARTRYYVSESGATLQVQWDIEGYRLVVERLHADGVRVRNAIQLGQAPGRFDIFLGTGPQAIHSVQARLVGSDINVLYKDRPDFMLRGAGADAILWDGERFQAVSHAQLQDAQSMTLAARQRGEAAAREQRRQFWQDVSGGLSALPQTLEESRPEARELPTAQREQKAAAAPATPERSGTRAAQGGTRLVFFAWVGLNEVLNGQNGQCASQIIEIPAPPGWHPGVNKVGSALAAVQPYRDRIKAACGQRYKLGRGEANIVWNDNMSIEEVRQAHARIRHDRQAFVDI